MSLSEMEMMSSTNSTSTATSTSDNNGTIINITDSASSTTTTTPSTTTTSLYDYYDVLPSTAHVPIGLTIIGIISILGSYIILRELFYEAQHKQSTRRGAAPRAGSGGRFSSLSIQKLSPTSRMLGWVCISDILWSLAWGTSTFPSPKDGVDYIWGPIGNVTTCTIQGFTLSLGGALSGPFNALLSYYYVLMVQYNYTDIQLSKYEPYVVSLVWIIAICLATLPLKDQLYNNLHFNCFLAPYPRNCAYWITDTDHDDDDHDNEILNNDRPKCIRGNSPNLLLIDTIYRLYQFPFFFIVIINMIRIYYTVRKLENRNYNHRTSFWIGGGGRSSGGAGSSSITTMRHSRIRILSRTSRTSTTENRQGGISSSRMSAASSDAFGTDNANDQSQPYAAALVAAETSTDQGQQVQQPPPQEQHRTSSDTDNNNNHTPGTTADRMTSSSSLPRETSSTILTVDRRRSSSVAFQGLWYAGSFLFLWIPMTATRIVYSLGGSNRIMGVVATLIIGVQGLLTSIIFIRKHDMKTTEGKYYRATMCWILKVGMTILYPFHYAFCVVLLPCRRNGDDEGGNTNRWMPSYLCCCRCNKQLQENVEDVNGGQNPRPRIQVRNDVTTTNSNSAAGGTLNNESNISARPLSGGTNLSSEEVS